MYLFNRLYGVKVIGLDLNVAAVEWAQKHSIGNFYATDAVNMSWIPDNTFDHFFSFAAVYYVPPQDVCHFGKEVVRILKPQGTALFGWLSGKYSHPFFGKVITSTKKYHAHDEKNKFKIGDIIKIIESKPFSKKKKWEVMNK